MLELIKEVKESKKRNFTQSIDLSISLKNIDLKRPENRFNEKLELPHKVGEKKICVIGSSLKDKAKNADLFLSSKDIEKYYGDKKMAKKLAKEYDFFLSEPQIMQSFAKNLGAIFGPRGKMPEVVTPNMDLNEKIESLKRTIILRLRDNPVINCKVGNEKMSEEEIKENVETVLNFVKSKLPKGEANIKNISIKLTMGPSFRLR